MKNIDFKELNKVLIKINRWSTTSVCKKFIFTKEELFLLHKYLMALEKQNKKLGKMFRKYTRKEYMWFSKKDLK